MMKTDTVTFSVIMPAYNSEAYVHAAVDSVLRQTYPHWELIVVNDGSTDQTLPILERYASADGRVRVYSKSNGGYVSAVNYGAEKAVGDYFCFMGSDDQLSADLFEKIAAGLDESRPDLIGFKTVRWMGDQRTPDPSTSFDSFAQMNDTDIRTFASRYPAHSMIFFIRDTSKLYKKSLLGDLREFGRYGLDADGIFSMLFAHKARSFVSVPVEGYYWTLRPDSVSGRPHTREVNEDRIRNWTRFFEILAEYPADSITPQEQEYVHHFARVLKEYVVQNGVNAFVRESIGAVRKAVRRYSLKMGWKMRFFLRCPGASAFLLSHTRQSFSIFFKDRKKAKKIVKNT